jgi:uncharacterized membrane protein YbaN (DUF454 family)
MNILLSILGILMAAVGITVGIFQVNLPMSTIAGSVLFTQGMVMMLSARN